MKIQIKTITPEWAKKMLETRNPRNRRISEQSVVKMARDIKSGAYLETHQGIGIDTNGDLLDGQHRLAAIVMAGVPVKMPIATGVQASKRINGITLNTFEIIDSGKQRGVGQMLQMAGFVNGNAVAASVRIALNLAAGDDSAPISTAQAHAALKYFGHSVETITSISKSGQILNPPSYVRAVASIFHTVKPERAEQFISEVGDVSGARGSATRALATWIRSHPHQSGSGAVGPAAKAAASALFHFENSNSVSKIYPNDAAMKWLLGLNKPLMQKLAAILN